MSQVDLGWRRFNFFDKTPVTDPSTGEKFLGLKDVTVECWTSAQDAVYLGENRGAVFRLGKDLQVYVWRPYEKSLTGLKAVGDFLVSLGEDEQNINSVIKIWDMDKLEKDTPAMIKSIKVGHCGNTSAPCTSFAVHSSFGAIAAGFGDGSAAVFTGDFLKDKGVNGRWLRVQESSPQDGAVSGLALAEVAPGSGRFVLFLLTARTIRSFVIENKQVTHKLRHDDANGASRRCWTFSERTGQLIVANKDMVYFYEADQCLLPDGTQGRCHALGRTHETLQLVEAGGCVALLTKQPALIVTAEAEWMSMVSVYDVVGQYIGFSCSLPATCTLFVLNDTLTILSHDGTLSQLIPKHLNSKLEILYKKNFYDVAINLAKRSEDAAERLPSIHAKYADYFYSKGDFDNAMNQYKETIGTLEPSYVIKRFLDGSKIHQLCAYLEALHANGVHNTHHTSILINCYAKIGDRKKIREFIETTRENCDFEGAFNVLRASKYYPEAAGLSRLRGLHRCYLLIMIEDLKDFKKAINYLKSLPPIQACEYVVDFGKVLLDGCPDETMDLLVQLMDGLDPESFDVSKLLKIFVSDPERATQFIEKALETVGAYGLSTVEASAPSAITLRNTILELKLRDYAKGQMSDVEIVHAAQSLLDSGPLPRALELAQIFECPPLVEYIYVKEKRITDLINFYMKCGKLESIITQCELEKSPDLWLTALVYVSKLTTDVPESTVTRMLNSISSTNCVHPLTVLEILSRSNTLKVSAVRDYVIKWLTEQQKQLDVDKKLITDSEAKMTEISNQIDNLSFNAQVIQVGKCCACATSLQLPAVHFLCRHSFHVHCFDSYAEDNPDQCPACAHKRGQAASMRDENFAQKSSYNAFRDQLKTNVNGMSVVADYLKRGLFNSTPSALHNTRMHSPSGNRQNPFADHLTTKNPFEDDEDELHPISIQRSHSTMSRTTVDSSAAGNNPFDEPTPKFRNPFENASTNPFEQEED